MMFKKKFIFVLLVINLISISFISCLSIYAYRQYYHRYIVDLETRIVQENENVVSAYVISDIGDWTDMKLRILIMFKGNQWMQVYNVTKTQDRIDTYSVNDHSIFYYRRKINTGDEIPFDTVRYYPTFETVMDIKLENLNQLIQNFDDIVAYLNSLENINSEKFKNKPIDWFWCDEAGFKRVRLWNYAESAWNYEGIVFKYPVSKPQVAIFDRRIES